MSGAPAGSSAMSIDTDGDGLSDAFELMILTNSTNPDTDGDGLSDGEEVLIYFTDPIFADTDLDRLSDYDEVFVYGTNPLLLDTDNDGLTDGLELDPLFGSNPLARDTDGDTLIDGDEVSLGLDLLFPNPIGVVTEIFCYDFIAVDVGGIEGVYERGLILNGGFSFGFLPFDLVALAQPLPGDRTGSVRANLRTGETGFFDYNGDSAVGGGFITGSAPTTLSIRIFLSSGFSFVVNLFDQSETYDWFVGDYAEIVDRGFSLEMVNADACEAVLVSP